MTKILIVDDDEYRIRHKDGSGRYVADRGMPVYGQEGKLLHFDGMEAFL